MSDISSGVILLYVYAHSLNVYTLLLASVILPLAYINLRFHTMADFLDDDKRTERYSCKAIIVNYV